MRFMLAAIATILSVQSAGAQQLPCANRERVLGFVIDQRGETRLATGGLQPARGNPA